MKTNTDASKALDHIFSKKVFCGLLRTRKNSVFDSVVRRCINAYEHKTYEGLFQELYSLLAKQRRNEYYYTNTLLNQLLDGFNDHGSIAIFPQVHISRSIADLVTINNGACVYEIKSELDNFDRLASQLRDYFKAFSKVCVLTSMHGLAKLRKVLSELGDMGDTVGIYVLSDTTFAEEYKRGSQKYDRFLEHASIFKLLRKREYERVVLSYFGCLPKVAPVFHFRTCLEWFSHIPIRDAQRLAFQELQKRDKTTATELKQIPSELQAVVYFSGLVRRLPQLKQLFQAKYGT